MSTGVIFILGKGVTPILAYGVKSTWPQGSSAPGFSRRCGKISFPGIITRFSELRIIRKNGYEYHNTGFRLFENHCNFAATLDLQRQTETEIEMINLQ